MLSPLVKRSILQTPQHFGLIWIIVISTFYKVTVTSGSLGTAGDLRLEPELSLRDSRVSIRTSLATPWLIMLPGKPKTSGERAHLSGRGRGYLLFVDPDL